MPVHVRRFSALMVAASFAAAFALLLVVIFVLMFALVFLLTVTVGTERTLVFAVVTLAALFTRALPGTLRRLRAVPVATG